MDPASYLHLSDINYDIRPSRIGIYSLCDDKTTTLICVDFQDGRLDELADEPYNRIRDVVQQSLDSNTDLGPAATHAAILAISARWWTDVLAQIKGKLVYYVCSVSTPWRPLPRC